MNRSYPIMNLSGRRMGAGGETSPSYETLCQYAKDFKEAHDKGYSDAGPMEAFNRFLDAAIRNGESPFDLIMAIQGICGVPPGYMNVLRPLLYKNPLTLEDLTYQTPSAITAGKGGKPGTATPGGKGGPTRPVPPVSPPEPGSPASFMRPWVQTPSTPVPPPVSTGGAHSYEEEASDYSERLKEYQRVATESARRANEQIRASNASRDAQMEALRRQYEDVATPATVSQQQTQTQETAQLPPAGMTQRPSDVPSVDCSHLGPYAYWDGRQCRSANMTSGSLVSQAMNLGPSGGVSAPSFGGEGYASGGAPGAYSMAGRQRFKVVNL